MRWFRSQRRLGAWAALFALAVQFVVAFGHVHVGSTATPSLLVALAGPAIGHEPQPHRGSHHASDELCAICVVSGLIGSAQIATPPVLLPPPTLTAALLPLAADAARTEQRRVAFRSRAPPIV